MIRKLDKFKYRDLLLNSDKLNENKNNQNNELKSKPSLEVEKNFDKEHSTIERIFRISLDESDKFLYLEFFHAQLLSQDKEIAFRINQLDDIMIEILNNEERVKIYL